MPKLLPHKRILALNPGNKYPFLAKIINWIKKNTRTFVVISTALLFIIFTLSVIIYDRKKAFDYVPEKNLSYTHLDWKEKADDEGFSHTGSDLNSFDWRVDIYVPNTSFLFVVKDIAIQEMTIRNIEGTVPIPASFVFDGMEKYQVKDNKRILTNTGEDIVLKNKTHYASFLGLDFVSGLNAKTFRINNFNFNTATFHLPSRSTIIKKGDGMNPADSYDVTERDIMFHNFLTPAIVYYNNFFHTLVQIYFIIVIFLLILLGVFLSRKKIKKGIHINTKKISFAILITSLIMIFASLAIPNPQAIILNWDSRPDVKYNTDHLIGNDAEIPDYLWWVLGITRSIDAMIIGQNDNCSKNSRHFYLTEKSVHKFFIIEEFENTNCAFVAKTNAPDKVEIVKQNEVENKINAISREPFLGNLFSYNVKIIVLLSNLIITLVTMLLLYRAFTITKIKDIIITIIIGFLSFFGLMGLYILCGYLAHMPITYHAKNNLGFIMTNYFFPGVVAGGNNVRTIASVLGAVFLIFFVLKVSRRIAHSVFILASIIILTTFVFPQSEYMSKRFFLTFTSAEAYQWDYIQDNLNPFDLYRATRDYTLFGYLQLATSKKNAGFREILFSESLNSEERYVESIDANKESIKRYDDIPIVVALSHFELGESLYDLRNSDLIIQDFLDSNYPSPYIFYVEEAKKNYNEFLKIVHNNFDLEEGNPIITEVIALPHEGSDYYFQRAIYNRSFCSFLLSEYNKAIIGFEEYLEKYPDGIYVKLANYHLAKSLFHNGEYSKATHYLEKYTRDYPDISSDPEIMSLIARSYSFNNNKERAQEIFIEASLNPEIKPDNLANLQLETAIDYSKNNNREDSTKKFEELLLSYPDNLFIISQLFLNLEQYYEAHNRDFFSCFKEAMTFFENKEYYEAVDKYEECLTLTNNAVFEIVTRFQIARVLINLNEIDKAETIYYNLSSQYPNTIIALNSNKNLALIDDNINEAKQISEQIVLSLQKEIQANNPDVEFEQKTPEKNNITKTEDKLEDTNTNSAIQNITADVINLSVLSKGVILSRGMALFFTGVLVMLTLLILRKNFRTLVLPVVIFIISRGIIRIGEQDPFRAIKSIIPGIITGIQIIAVFLIVNVILYIIFHPKKAITKITSSRDYFKSIKKDPKNSSKKIIKLFKPKV